MRYYTIINGDVNPFCKLHMGSAMDHYVITNGFVNEIRKALQPKVINRLRCKGHHRKPLGRISLYREDQRVKLPVGTTIGHYVTLP